MRHTSGLLSGILALATVFLSSQAVALELAQAIEKCRGSVGRPMVMACMHSGGGSLESCKASVASKVKACVLSAMTSANARSNVPIAIKSGNGPLQESVSLSRALPAGFMPPPRTITDITAVLDSEKPDPDKLAKRRTGASRDPPKNIAGSDLAEFYLKRAFARSELGQSAEAISDAGKALSAGRGGAQNVLLNRAKQFIGIQQVGRGDLKAALQTFVEMTRDVNAQGLFSKAFLFNTNRMVSQTLIQMGDTSQADGYLQRNLALLREARTSGHPYWRNGYSMAGRSWEGEIEDQRALIFEARGQLSEAEAAYRKSGEWRRAAIPDMLKMDYAPSESTLLFAADFSLLNAARMKAKQGRLAEAEVDTRRVLLTRLKDQGKYNPLTTRFVIGLAGVLTEEGRYADAEKITRTAIEIQRTIGIGDDTQFSAQILSQLGAILTFQRKSEDAAGTYAQLENAISKWEPRRRQFLDLNSSRIIALYASGQVEAGIAAAEVLLKLELDRVGEKHFDTAAARGTLAVGYQRAGRNTDAIREFKAAIPALMAVSSENADGDDDTVLAARSGRLQYVIEAYIGLLARNPDAVGGQGALETFALADAIRGQSVQRALSASSVRASVKDPALAELVRKEQDLGKRINAELGALNNALSSDARDDKVIKATNFAIDNLRAERDRIRAEINKRFPSYADLVDPKPPSVSQIKATLVDGEAMLSFYFGQDASFVWAVPKEGAAAFAAINATGGEIEGKVRKLREALEPQAAMISDIPPFDLKLGYELYSLLLQPVEVGWKQSKSLIVVTNGALGLLPLSLLPTAPAQIDTNDDPLFSSYRAVPWLARNYAVTMVPSSAALRTLRQLPPGKPGRGELLAFGDPLFSVEQAAEAKNQEALVKVAHADAATTRGMPLKRRSSPKLEGVDSAELAMLPRLPDTADELKSIAQALQADPSKVLNLGKSANEENVKTLDLSGFKILAFATHGLVPGELNGLTQPALALSSPAVTGGDGDGLLTMEEILGLKLDADWVVLSACNTGAGAEAGAEAASGLGRAFFYAGTRALLVTNWSVHSQSARELVTDLFKRQAGDPKLTRGEALRQAMMALADGPGYIGADGKTEFAYAHPLFWAPYSIIGDGGAR